MAEGTDTYNLCNGTLVQVNGGMNHASNYLIVYTFIEEPVSYQDQLPISLKYSYALRSLLH